MNADEIIEVLIKARKIRRLDQVEAAKKIGIGVTSLSLYETQKRSPDILTVVNWCEAFGKILIIIDRP